MKEIFIVVRSGALTGIFYEGAYSNFDAAYQCAIDQDADQIGFIWRITADDVEDTYHSQ